MFCVPCYLMTDTTGQPDGQRTKHRAASFANTFKRWCKDASLPHCSAHGLRKAASVMLVQAGCTSAEAMAIIGHDSLAVFETYMRARDQGALADTAMVRLISKTKPGQIVPSEIEISENETLINANLLKGNGYEKVWLPELDSNQ